MITSTQLSAANAMYSFAHITLSCMSHDAAEAKACACSTIGTFIAFASATAPSHVGSSSTHSFGFTGPTGVGRGGGGVGRGFGSLGGGGVPPPFASAGTAVTERLA